MIGKGNNGRDIDGASGRVDTEVEALREAEGKGGLLPARGIKTTTEVQTQWEAV